MRDFVDRIPREGKIMVQNNFAVFFTHDDLYLLGNCKVIKKVQPDVIAFDIRPGQSPNNLWPSNEEEMWQNAELLKGSRQYKILYEDERRFIFVKTPDDSIGLNCKDNEEK